MLLQGQGLCRCYGRGDAAVTALADAALAIEDGEFVAIMGPSGSGKSTLMNLIGLLDRPTAGRLIFTGHDVTRLSPDRLAGLRNGEIGFIFQSYNLLARHTARENVELPLVYGGIKPRERARRARAALDAVGLGHRADHAPAQLSGGEQQRVAIARALVNDPALILADEPTGALDSRTGEMILGLFREFNLAGRSIVMVTHDAAVAGHAARIIRLRDGRIVDDGSAVPAAPALLEVET